MAEDDLREDSENCRTEKFLAGAVTMGNRRKEFGDGYVSPSLCLFCPYEVEEVE